MLSAKDLGGAGTGTAKTWENWKVEVGEGGRGEGKREEKDKEEQTK